MIVDEGLPLKELKVLKELKDEKNTLIKINEKEKTENKSPTSTLLTTTKKKTTYRTSTIQLSDIRILHPEIYDALKSLSSSGFYSSTKFSKHGCIWFGLNGYGGTRKYFLKRVQEEGTLAVIENLELTLDEKNLLMGLCLYGGGKFATYDDFLEYMNEEGSRSSSKGV